MSPPSDAEVADQEHNNITNSSGALSPPSLNEPHFSSADECLIVTALAIAGIQSHLLTSDSVATSAALRALIALGILLDLLGLLLIISIPRHICSASSPMLVHCAPAVAIVFGILALAIVIVFDTIKPSLGAAVVMGCVIIAGCISCILVFWGRARQRM